MINYGRRPALALFALLALTVGVATSCNRAPAPKAPAREFIMRGIIRSATPDHRTLEIQHETIPDYMPSMTMAFAVKDPKTTASLKKGDAISCRLTVQGTDAVIDNIVKIKTEDVQLGGPTPASNQ